MTDWNCTDCNSFQIIGIDAPGYEDVSQQMIASHQAVHAAQLAEHDGDHADLKLRLRHPALHVAVAAVRGRLEGRR